jgi:hypothetical protein
MWEKNKNTKNRTNLMVNIRLICLVFALVCFLIAAWQPANPIWNRLIAAGLAAFVLAGLL